MGILDFLKEKVSNLVESISSGYEKASNYFSGHIYTPAQEPIAEHDFYASSPFNQDKNYLTIFEGTYVNPDTGEEENNYFAISHDDLLSEEDAWGAVDDFSEDSSQDYTSIEPVAGYTTFGEEVAQEW